MTERDAFRYLEAYINSRNMGKKQQADHFLLQVYMFLKPKDGTS